MCDRLRHNCTWVSRLDVQDAYDNDDNDDNDDNSTNIKAWNVANAGADTDDLQSRVLVDMSITSDGIFDGGFYGKCDGKWNYTDATGEWGCNGLPEAEPQTINVQPYKIPNTGDSNLSGDWVGFKIPGGEWEKWGDAYPEAFGSSYAGNLELRASCFQTGNENNPSKWANVTDTRPGASGDWIVGVQLPKDQDNGYNSYNCKFGFQQEVYDYVPNHLYWNWKQLDATTTNLNYWPSTFGDFTDSPKPIVEGRDFPGLIRTYTLDAREPQGVSNVQSWLADHSAEEVSGSPFTQFPASGVSSRCRNPSTCS